MLRLILIFLGMLARLWNKSEVIVPFDSKKKKAWNLRFNVLTPVFSEQIGSYTLKTLKLVNGTESILELVVDTTWS